MHISFATLCPHSPGGFDPPGEGIPLEALAFWGDWIAQMNPLRTIVYVDGFNFYYGALRGTPWKWLDLSVFFQNLLGARNSIVGIK